MKTFCFKCYKIFIINNHLPSSVMSFGPLYFTMKFKSPSSLIGLHGLTLQI